MNNMCYNFSIEGDYMNILFLGDSITEGVPGVSYVDVLRKEPTFQCVNRGKGGDTVSSLFRRVKRMDDLASYDKILVFVGVNDVFGRITMVHKFFKLARRQKWAKNVQVFEKQYRVLLEYLLKRNSNILIVSPLLIGEDLSNKHNLSLRTYINRIDKLAKEYPVEYLDAYTVFAKQLQDKECSKYLPIKLSQIYQDSKLKEPSKLEEIYLKRGLFLTIDGVHLNEEGANLIASSIKETIKKAKKKS